MADIERTPISEFRKLTLSMRWPTQPELDAQTYHPGDIVFVDTATGEPVAQASADDLFDVNGNRFWLDA
jgi:hypothetical protein